MLPRAEAELPGSTESEALTKPQITGTDPTAVLLPKIELAKRHKEHSVAKLTVGTGLTIVLIIFGVFGYRYFTFRTKIESIAIRPFVNEGGNADVEYLSDGMTESLINSLSQLSGLSVKGRSSVFRFKGKDIDPQQLAVELKVQAVLNGRVMQRGDSLILSLDLVDASTGSLERTNVGTLRNEA